MYILIIINIIMHHINFSFRIIFGCIYFWKPKYCKYNEMKESYYFNFINILLDNLLNEDHIFIIL